MVAPTTFMLAVADSKFVFVVVDAWPTFFHAAGSFLRAVSYLSNAVFSAVNSAALTEISICDLTATEHPAYAF